MVVHLVGRGGLVRTLNPRAAPPFPESDSGSHKTAKGEQGRGAPFREEQQS